MPVLSFRTKFHRRARKLKGPTSPGFDANEWRAAIAELGEGNTTDDVLLESALWLNEQYAALRAEFPPSKLQNVGKRASTLLCVAALNREGRVIRNLSAKAYKSAEAEGVRALHSLVSAPIAGGYKEQRRTPADIVETVVDAAESWLYDASRKEGEGDIPTDIEHSIHQSISIYSLHHTLNDMWQQALWEGWGLCDSDSGGKTWRPSDREQSTLFSAWMIREQENFMNYPWIDVMTWPVMSRDKRRRLCLPFTISKVTSSGRIKVAPANQKASIPPPYRIDVSGLEGSYLREFMHEPLPKAPQLSVVLIVKCWDIIRSVAEHLESSLKEPDQWQTQDVRRWALVVERSELRLAIATALNVEQELAEQAIKFLSFETGTAYKGLWGSPIVPLDEHEVALVHLVLSKSSGMRRAEIWLQKGGLDDTLAHNSRGDVFERRYRAELRTRVAANPLLSSTRVAISEIKKDKEFDEQVDLLILLGGLLVVGEVKCFLSPADPRERFNYLENIISAAAQANRKAQALTARPEVVAKALGVREDDVKWNDVVPIVVVNQGAGFSLEIDGCIVVDAGFLVSYLGGSELVVGAAIQPGTGRAAQSKITLYSSEQDCAGRFVDTMRQPMILQRFVDRIEWSTLSFPTANGTDISAEYPFLKDFSDSDRVVAEEMRAAALES